MSRLELLPSVLRPRAVNRNEQDGIITTLPAGPMTAAVACWLACPRDKCFGLPLHFFRHRADALEAAGLAE